MTVTILKHCNGCRQQVVLQGTPRMIEAILAEIDNEGAEWRCETCQDSPVYRDHEHRMCEQTS